MGRALADLPRVEVISAFVSRTDVRRHLQAAHVFVLPTRGEGWGLPIVEAMVMALPVIATNHSGPTAYLRSDNSFPIPSEGVDLHGFASPSTTFVERALKHCLEDYPEAQARGRRGAQFIREHFSAQKISDLMIQRLEKLSGLLDGASSASGEVEDEDGHGTHAGSGVMTVGV